MEINIKNSEAVRKMDTDEVTIGQTTYVVKTNAKSVPTAFVKKTVQKLLFGTLKQKVRKSMDKPLSPCYNIDNENESSHRLRQQSAANAAIYISRFTQPSKSLIWETASGSYNINKVWNCVLFKRREEDNYELERRNNRKQWSNCSLLPFKL